MMYKVDVRTGETSLGDTGIPTLYRGFSSLPVLAMG